MLNYFCFINNQRFIFIYNINENKLFNYDDNAESLCYNNEYLIYSNCNLLSIMNIKTRKVIKMISINNDEYDYINISDIVIINNNITIRVNYSTFYIDRQGIFYKKSAMMTFDIDSLEQLYTTDNFNTYNMIASNTKIIGRYNDKIIVFNEKLEILSEIKSMMNYNIKNIFGDDNITLIEQHHFISPDNKYIFLLNTNISIFDIDRTILYETIQLSTNNNINNNSLIITNDYRIIYWTDKINIIKTSLYNNLINFISNNLSNYLPIELVDNVLNYL